MAESSRNSEPCGILTCFFLYPPLPNSMVAFKTIQLNYSIYENQWPSSHKKGQSGCGTPPKSPIPREMSLFELFGSS